MATDHIRSLIKRKRKLRARFMNSYFQGDKKLCNKINTRVKEELKTCFKERQNKIVFWDKEQPPIPGAKYLSEDDLRNSRGICRLNGGSFNYKE
ncbi:hypothetical protein Zmor_012250 [Zophobas morio]|uniref:Uncharacterized protein n=1 Tax=Zophobas morio TaxID=2755281 RepID=A0AA38HG59_9CUCU|nr:hypothetical protein Zmor_012250 [Zophobas morio]